MVKKIRNAICSFCRRGREVEAGLVSFCSVGTRNLVLIIF
jgi:hypothetical protein